MTASACSSLTQCQHVANENEEECQEEQYSICPHCKLWLCGIHLQEHQQIVQVNANVINDRANQVRQQLAEISVGHLYEGYKKKVDEWRDQMYADINIRHTQMIEELHKLHNELIEEVNEFKNKKIGSFASEIAEPLTHMLTKQKQVHPNKLNVIEMKLQLLERKMEEINQPDLIHMNCDEFKLNGEIKFTRQHPCIEMELVCEDKPLQLQEVLKGTVNRFQSSSKCIALAASSEYILTIEDSSKLVLFNKNGRVQSVNVENIGISDICWSDTMKVFFIASKHLQIYDVLSNTLKYSDMKSSNAKFTIRSITAYNHNVFLIYNNGVIARYLLPSFTQKTMWLKDEYLEAEGDQTARCIRVNSSGVLAISIKQNDSHWRIDLFNTYMQRLHRGVSFTDDKTNGIGICMFISIPNNEWLVMNNSSKPNTMSTLDNESRLKQQVEKHGFNVALMGSEFLVLRDGAGLYLYKLTKEND